MGGKVDPFFIGFWTVTFILGKGSKRVKCGWANSRWLQTCRQACMRRVIVVIAREGSVGTMTTNEQEEVCTATRCDGGTARHIGSGGGAK